MELIDYTNAYEQRPKKIFYTENGRLSGYLTAAIKNICFKKKHYWKKAFAHPEKLYPISQTRYKSHQELESAAYDVLIVGSDQVWNPHITNGMDMAFWLQFGRADKRISMASSMGSHTMTQGERELVSNALTSFTSISTREPFCKEQLASLTDKPIKILLDPTFLYKRERWATQLASKSPYSQKTGKYILTFFVAPDSSYKQRVQEYADMTGLPVWSIQSTIIKRTNCQKSILGATVADFVALIQNADLVITDSFHGVAMSLIMGVNFVAFKNTGNPVRVANLLDTLGIGNRVDMPASAYESVPYEQVREKLVPLCEDSREWVRRAIDEGAPESD